MEYTSSIDAGAGLESRITESPETVWNDIDDDLEGGSYTTRVTPESAQRFGPVWQAMNVYADDVAQLPLMAYRREADGDKMRDPTHEADYLLHRRPNGEMGPFQFKYLMTARLLMWGNSYAYIEREHGLPVGLWPINPGEIYPMRVNGKLRYVVPNSTSGLPSILDPMEVLHLRGPGTDELISPSIIAKARQTIEGGINVETYGTRFYSNDAKPGLVLEFPNPVKEDTARNILKHWERRHRGTRNAGRPAFIDNGGKVTSFGMNNTDAQWLEGKKFSRTEIAGWFKLPPHKLNDLERATFSNIEHQSIQYVVGSLMPWLVRWQDECNFKLLQENEFRNDTHYLEFSVNALLKGDAKSRSEFYNNGVMGGWLSRNEVRSLENLNKLDGLDAPLQPLNMVPVGESAPGEVETIVAGEDARTMLAENLCRMLAKASQAAAKKPQAFVDWIDTGARETHGVHAKSQIEACCGSDATAAMDHLFSRLRELMLAASDGEPSGFTNRVKEAGTSLVTEGVKIILGEEDGTAT